MNKLEQAARALLAHWDTPAWKYLKPTGDLMADLREALASCRLTTTEQAEQEPVAWVDEDGFPWKYNLDGKDWVPLYAAPVRTKDLTDDEIVDVMNKIYGSMWTEQDRDFARAVIAADREKNNANNNT